MRIKKEIIYFCRLFLFLTSGSDRLFMDGVIQYGKQNKSVHIRFKLESGGKDDSLFGCGFSRECFNELYNRVCNWCSFEK